METMRKVHSGDRVQDDEMGNDEDDFDEETANVSERGKPSLVSGLRSKPFPSAQERPPKQPSAWSLWSKGSKGSKDKEEEKEAKAAILAQKSEERNLEVPHADGRSNASINTNNSGLDVEAAATSEAPEAAKNTVTAKAR